MSPSLILDALLVWSTQILVLVAFGALAARAFAHPKSRLLFWQGLLLIMLLLPIIEPWRQPPPEVSAAMIYGGDLSLPAGETIRGLDLPRWRREDLLLLILAGIGIRLLWITIGFLRLRRYRREARPLWEPPVPFGSASARWYLHDTVPGPVTYGWLRPSILLPAAFVEFPPSVREAIACHELVHVMRRDWLFVIGEELVRCAFWFHPAAWFVLSQIHLAREQSVDQEVIRLTSDRECYVEALMTVAKQKIRTDLAPASLFLKRRHLARRVAAIFQEVSMSRPRVYTALATVCSAAFLAARLSIWLIPFSIPAQVLPDDPGVAVDPGGTILHRTPVHFPSGVKTSGTVVIAVSMGSKGDVIDARVLSGPEELRKSALASVLNWHYEAGSSPVQVTVKFGEASALAEASAPPTRNAPVVSRPPTPPISSSPPVGLHAGRSDSAAETYPAVIKEISVNGLSADAEQQLRTRLQFREGSSVRLEDVSSIYKMVDDFDRHLKTTVQIAGKDEIILRISLPSESPEPSGVSESLAVAALPPPAPGVQRLRVGGNVQAANLVNKVTPKYPLEAKQARIQGTVRFAALIGTDGAIQELRLVSGVPVLADAATEAVKQWVYRPTLVNGNPVEVLTLIDINFTLAY